MATRNFSQIAKELEEIASRLNQANDPDTRHELLHRMRQLLQEADTIKTNPPATQS